MSIIANTAKVIDHAGLLDRIPQPLLVLDPTGVVKYANFSSREFFGPGVVGSNLVHRVPPDQQSYLQTYLLRCTGSASPSIGAFAISSQDNLVRRFRSYGFRLVSPAGPDVIHVALRLEDAQESQFSILAQTVKKLNQQISLNYKVRSALEQALDARDVLLREMHHRIRNNLQILLSMFGSASRTAKTTELSDFLKKARSRLLAITAVHDAMHVSNELETSLSTDLLPGIVRGVCQALSPDVKIVGEIESCRISNQTLLPLALILNELITNACKHGLKGGDGTIEVNFGRSDDAYELIVADTGPGCPSVEPDSPHKGLGLIRSLTMQLNGEFDVIASNGARFRVRFPEADTNARND